MATVYDVQGNRVRHHLRPQKEETLWQLSNYMGCNTVILRDHLGRGVPVSVESTGATMAPKLGGVRVVLKSLEVGGNRKEHDIGVVGVACDSRGFAILTGDTLH